MGAYTTRNAPAPENGDEIVAGPIEAAHYFAQYCRYAARDGRELVL
jgi:hypothetical protein